VAARALVVVVDGGELVNVIILYIYIIYIITVKGGLGCCIFYYILYSLNLNPSSQLRRQPD
jgi:hypothetical protein